MSKKLPNGVTPEMAQNTLGFIRYQQLMELVKWAKKYGKPFGVRHIVEEFSDKGWTTETILEMVDQLMSKELAFFVLNDEALKKDPNLKRLVTEE